MTDPTEMATELPLTDLQADIERLVEKLKGHPRNCGRHAFEHLRKAWRLYNIDAEMSLFRALTAEEEAATALILALKAKQYPGANRLDHRNHHHKVGAAPFLYAVGKVLGAMEYAQPQIHLSLAGNDRDQPRLDVSFNAMGMGVGRDPEQRMEIDEPFNFVAREGLHGGPAEVMTFARELEALASERGAAELLDFVREEANLRNRLLYAQPGGLPKVTFPKDQILKKLNRVCAVMQVVIGILQTPKHQLFAVQCVEAYLAALHKMPDEPFHFDDKERPKGDHDRIIVNRIGDGPPVAEMELTREVRLDRIVVGADRIDFHMTGVNDGADYRVNLREVPPATPV